MVEVVIVRVAVCDDEKLFVDSTVTHIKNILIAPGECVICSFFSGEELLREHQQNRFDIIFLDIEMNGISGIDIARKIREKDDKTIIVFLTSHEEFAIEGYEVKAYRYIVKNEPEYVYNKQIQATFEEYFQKHKVLKINDKHKMSCVYLKDICYVTVSNKTVVVHTLTEKYEYFGKLSDIEVELKNAPQFVKSHKSFIVNVEQIETIYKDYILMKNKKKVFLSRRNKKNLVDKYVLYMTGR